MVYGAGPHGPLLAVVQEGVKMMFGTRTAVVLFVIVLLAAAFGFSLPHAFAQDIPLDQELPFVVFLPLAANGSGTQPTPTSTSTPTPSPTATES